MLAERKKSDKVRCTYEQHRTRHIRVRTETIRAHGKRALASGRGRRLPRRVRVCVRAAVARARA